MANGRVSKKTTFNNPGSINRLRSRESARLSGAQSLLQTPASGQSPTGSSLANRGEDNASAVQQNAAQSISRSRDATSPAPKPTAREDVTHEDVEDEWRPRMNDDGDETYGSAYPPGGAPYESSSDALRRIRRQRAEQNKENVRQPGQRERAKPRYFNETQEGAERVSPISSDDGDASQHGNGESTGPPNGGQEDEDEDAFQSDERNVDTSRRRAQITRTRRPVPPRGASNRREPSQPNSPGEARNPTARAQTVRSSGTAPSGAQRQQNTTTRDGVRRPSTEDSDDSMTMESDDDEGRNRPEHERVNRLAKKVIAHRPKPVQRRKPWTAEATQRLIDYIQDDRYGTSWAKIDQKHDPLLEGRGQVGLKDKARNIKFDYLKTGIVLPVNFDRVALNRLQIDKLNELGIPYE